MIERSKVKSVELSFTRREASVKLRGSNEDMHWFEHFMMDLRRSVRRPRFSERGLGRKFLIIILSGLASTLPAPIQDEGLPSGAPYSIIILQQEPPSPLIEGIKVNLISNVIWVVAAFVAGIVLTAFIAWMYVNYGVNLNDLVPTPSIPTITPMP